MSKPTVSALMPVRLRTDSYTEIKWLRQAVQSCLDAAADVDLDIVIIDDCSFRPLQEVLAPFVADPRLQFIRNPVNMGLIRALNRGVKVARGDYIARIDADDFWQPNRFAVQFAAFERDPNLALSFGGMTLVNEKDEITDLHVRSFEWAEAIRFAQHVGCPIPHGSILARTSVMRVMGGYPYHLHTHHSEDFALWVRLLRFFKVKGEEALLLGYRIHGRSVSAENRAMQSANTHHIMEEFRRYGPADDFVAAMQRLPDFLGKSLLDVGVLLHDLWRYGGEVSAPLSAVNDLRRVLYDRVVTVQSSEGGTCQMIISEF